MINSRIPIRWKIQCIGLADYPYDIELSKDDIKEYLEYLNPPKRTKIRAKQLSNADIGIVIRRDTGKEFFFDIWLHLKWLHHLGDRGSVAIFHGIRNKRSSLVIREDFLLSKYGLLHEIGHLFGCAHERSKNLHSIIQSFIRSLFLQPLKKLGLVIYYIEFTMNQSYCSF